jgi:ribosomal protein S18 acetylase RimI-like enzyme
MTEHDITTSLEIAPLETAEEARLCARFMASAEPWTTLRRDYEASLAIFTDPARETYLVRVAGEVAGFVVIHMRGGFVGYIQSIGVLPGWKSQGIGTRLMDFAEERIFGESPNAVICVSSFNERVQRFYKRRGYHVVGELADYIVSGHSEILLRKTLWPLTEFRA